VAMLFCQIGRAHSLREVCGSLRSAEASSAIWAERHDAHQHGAARARHPDAVILDVALELAAVAMLEVEGFEGGGDRGYHRRIYFTTRARTASK